MKKCIGYHIFGTNNVKEMQIMRFPSVLKTYKSEIHSKCGRIYFCVKDILAIIILWGITFIGLESKHCKAFRKRLLPFSLKKDCLLRSKTA